MLPALTPSSGCSLSLPADQSPPAVDKDEDSMPALVTPGVPTDVDIPTPPTSDSDSDDSSSTYDDCPLVPATKMSPMGAAKCLHAEPKCIPLLTPGVMSPMVMHQWEMACTDFFRANKKILEHEQVAAILPGLKDMRARDWVATHGDHLADLDFPEFIKELQREFLPDGWDDELHAKIRNSRLKSSDSFPTWVNDICHLNIVLRNTEYYFLDIALRLQLDSLLDADLWNRCKNRNMKEVVDKVTRDTAGKTDEARLSCWIAEVRKLAEEHTNDTKQYLEAVEDLQRLPKRQALANPSRNANAVGGYKARGATTSSTQAASSSSSRKPPRLTDNERSLLFKHQGCLKCRRGYQNHRATDCPNDFLDG